jgi:hypothetical protein
MPKTEHILTVAMIGHGCEYLLEPFPEDDPIGNFYKNNVRVFSQACIPDLPSITASSKHRSIAISGREHMQSLSENSDTLSILEQYMSKCKPTYVKMFEDESIKTMHPEFDERLFDPRYNSRSCGTMTYLANKTFRFYDTSPTERSTHLYGIVLLDIRLKITNDDGSVEYERIFEAPTRNNDPILLNTHDGYSAFLNIIFPKKPTKDIKKELKDIGLPNNKSKLTEIDLVKLLDMYKYFTFVNILDYTCRVCVTGRNELMSRIILSPEQIEEIIANEQLYLSSSERFGGTRRKKNERKTKKSKNAKRIGKTRKSTR